MPFNEDRLFLRPNVQVEPLFDRWYAWSHLIPPGTAARNVTERHLKIMDSYLRAPQIHANAVKNPKMLGGPFMDYSGDRREEIAALKFAIEKDRPHLLQLSAAITELDAMLRQQAKGASLQPIYDRIPAALRGYVELVYDRNNHASFRLFESLLYKSRFYDPRAQSLMLSLIRSDDRPFVLSTPRLDSHDSVHLSMPFDHPSVDELFRLKKSPQTWRQIESLIPFNAEDAEDLRSLFTIQSPPPYERYNGNGLRWRYFGHACILLESHNTTLLFDPVLSYTYESGVSRYTYEDLPDTIDYVLITHNHQDHVLFETLLQIRHKVGQVIVPRSGSGHLQDPSLKLLLQRCGFKNVLELGDMEIVDFGEGVIQALPFLGEHADLDIATKSAYLVRIERNSLLFAADSCNIDPVLYEHIHREIGDVDVLFVGMECDGAPLTWLYGPLLTQPLDRAMDQSRRLAGCDYTQAMAIVKQFNCKEVYVYAMGQEPWLNYVMSIKYTDESRPIVESNKLIEACKRHSISAERLYGEKEILLEPKTRRAVTLTSPNSGRHHTTEPWETKA